MNRKILPDEQEKESHSQQRGEQVVAVATYSESGTYSENYKTDQCA